MHDHADVVELDHGEMAQQFVENVRLAGNQSGPCRDGWLSFERIAGRVPPLRYERALRLFMMRAMARQRVADTKGPAICGTASNWRCAVQAGRRFVQTTVPSCQPWTRRIVPGGDGFWPGRTGWSPSLRRPTHVRLDAALANAPMRRRDRQ